MCELLMQCRCRNFVLAKAWHVAVMTDLIEFVYVHGVHVKIN